MRSEWQEDRPVPAAQWTAHDAAALWRGIGYALLIEVLAVAGACLVIWGAKVIGWWPILPSS